LKVIFICDTHPSSVPNAGRVYALSAHQLPIALTMGNERYNKQIIGFNRNLILAKAIFFILYFPYAKAYGYSKIEPTLNLHYL
jgi:hypothetical protein